MSLDRLLIPSGDPPVPPAWKQNELLKHLRRQRLLGLVASFGPVEKFPHPWQVTARRFEPPENNLSTLDPDSTWSIFINAGVINDELVTMLYLRNQDPRGWVMPKDYVAPVIGDADYDPRWLERDSLDDPDDPPFMVISDPPPTGRSSTNADFSQIADLARPGIERGAFCGEDSWELELWRAHVILSATPFRANSFNASLPPPRLVKFRFSVLPALPGASYGASSGGWLELATLYYLRDPEEPEDAQIVVRPQETWPLWTVIAQPGGDLVNILDSAASGSVLPPGFAEVLEGELQDDLQGAARPLFWNV